MALKATLELDTKELTNIISQYLHAEGYEPTTTIEFRVQNVLTGYGMAERDIPTFVGVRVGVTAKKETDYTGLGNQMSQPVEPR